MVACRNLEKDQASQNCNMNGGDHTTPPIAEKRLAISDDDDDDDDRGQITFL